ncbi:MAG: hypothetical protein HYX74_03215 [Acidobacteria bacterium]|nr:hypothetical protein [Acidobacteriota bacterium]
MCLCIAAVAALVGIDDLTTPVSRALVGTVAVLALLGLIISSYFTAIAYRWINPESPYLPGFCRMGETTCARVIFTPRARVFGVPNSLLGQIYYLGLLGALASGQLWKGPLFGLVLAASALTVLLGVYLTWSLLFWTKIPCRLCFAGHAINALIFLLLLSASIHW